MRCNAKPIMILFRNEKKEVEAKASQNVSWKHTHWKTIIKIER
jgi:hypothetical protein